MSARKSRWEIVSSIDGQYFARFIAANGRKIFTSETYLRKRDAFRAVQVVRGSYVTFAPLPEIRDLTGTP